MNLCRLRWSSSSRTSAALFRQRKLTLAWPTPSTLESERKRACLWECLRSWSTWLRSDPATNNRFTVEFAKGTGSQVKVIWIKRQGAAGYFRGSIELCTPQGIALLGIGYWVPVCLQVFSYLGMFRCGIKHIIDCHVFLCSTLALCFRCQTQRDQLRLRLLCCWMNSEKGLTP